MNNFEDMELKQYQIVLVNFDPTIGSEIKRTRPCVVISPNEMNKYLQTIVIASVTNNFKNYPSRIEIKENSIKGWIMIDQIRTIDKKRIIKIFGSISEKEIINVKNVLKETFVD
jgi:mRNA interferase MazF